MTDSVIGILDALRGDEGHICIWDLPAEFDIVEEGGWTQEGKYQEAEYIVKHKPSGHHFCITQSRSDSYFSDWDYGESGLCEVKPVTEVITVTKWVAI